MKLIDANTEMTKILDLPDKNVKAAVFKNSSTICHERSWNKGRNKSVTKDREALTENHIGILNMKITMTQIRSHQ